MAKKTAAEEAAIAARTEGLVDEERLGLWLDEQDLPGRGHPVTVHFISGGASNEIFLVKRGDFESVLRRPPRIVPKGRNETMLREFRVLEALNGTDVPHPEAYVASDDPDVMGSSFYLMSLVDGWSPMNMDGWPEPFDTDLYARYGLGIQLVDGIARLSRVDWKARGLEGFGKPDGFHDRQVDRWLAHLNGVRVSRHSWPRGDRRVAPHATSPPSGSRASSTATTSSPTSCSATARRPGWPRWSTGRCRRSAILSSIWDG